MLDYWLSLFLSHLQLRTMQVIKTSWEEGMLLGRYNFLVWDEDGNTPFLQYTKAIAACLSSTIIPLDAHGNTSWRYYHQSICRVRVVCNDSLAEEACSPCKGNQLLPTNPPGHHTNKQYRKTVKMTRTQEITRYTSKRFEFLIQRLALASEQQATVMLLSTINCRC